MNDPESKHHSSGGDAMAAPADTDDVSTVALPRGPIPPPGDEIAKSSAFAVSGGSSVLGGTSVSGGTSTPAVVPNDKTVISKRVPIESPLPLIPTPQSLGQALVGKTLDHYELVEFVGGGGMGAVFRSIDTRLGRTVAVKVLSRDHTDEETIKRFRNEAQSAARLDHPNIARVYFVGEAEGWNYIVFEYIEGTNLRDIVDSQGPLPLETALDYTLQVAEALDHASNRDVVHRDIKPSNVLVMPSGQAKLVDMGLARLHQVESSSEDLTASGVMLGTFDYISPEQARDPRSADVRSDIYSLGCTLYFMLAGRPPFPEGTAVQKLLKHNSEEPPDLRLFRPEIPAPATALGARMLAKRPSQRQQSPQDLIAEVLSLAQQLGLSGLTRQSTALTAPPPAPSYWSRLMPIAVPIAALVLLLWMIDSLSRQGERPLSVAQPRLPKDRLELVPSSRQGSIPPGETKDSATETSDVPSIVKPAAGSAKGKVEEGSSKGSSAESTGSSSQAVTAEPGERPSIDGDSGQGAIATDTQGSSGRTEIHGSSSADPSPLSPMATAEVKRQIQRVIVRKDPAELPEPADAKVEYSLARACQVAADNKVDKVELAFDGPLVEQPFALQTLTRIEIAAAEKPNEAGARYRPVIVFQPQPLGNDTDQQMIRLSGGSRSQVTFRGVELRMELPEAPAARWSLLALYQLQSLDLFDSVLTVKCPGGAPGLVGYEPVAMLALQPYRPAEMMKMTDDMMAMQPSINVRLTNCIARGEATFLTAEEERPLNVYWNQGLLVTPLRLLDTRGCGQMKPSSQDKFEISLEHVTAIVPQGLVRQNRAAMPSHLRIEVNCRQSVLQWDEEAALFEFEGLDHQNDIKLHFAGNDNLYPPQSLFLRQKNAVGMLVMQPVPFEDHDDWGVDLGSDKLSWEREPPLPGDLPAHEHRPGHYVLEEGRFSGEGFDVNSLPKLPEGADFDRPAADAAADSR